jgi:hypothetical protein
LVGRTGDLLPITARESGANDPFSTIIKNQETDRLTDDMDALLVPGVGFGLNALVAGLVGLHVLALVRSLSALCY